jgi:hypothetical protein
VEATTAEANPSCQSCLTSPSRRSLHVQPRAGAANDATMATLMSAQASRRRSHHHDAADPLSHGPRMSAPSIVARPQVVEAESRRDSHPVLLGHARCRCCQAVGASAAGPRTTGAAACVVVAGPRAPPPWLSSPRLSRAPPCRTPPSPSPLWRPCRALLQLSWPWGPSPWQPTQWLRRAPPCRTLPPRPKAAIAGTSPERPVERGSDPPSRGSDPPSRGSSLHKSGSGHQPCPGRKEEGRMEGIRMERERER